MAFAQSLRMDHPTGDTNRRDLDTVIKDHVKKAFQERLAVDHRFVITNNTVDDADIGKHVQVSLSSAINTPSPANGQGVVYGKTVGGQMELFFKNYDDAEVQITNNGVLNVAAASLAGLFDNVTVTQVGGLLAVKDDGITKEKINVSALDGASITKNGSGTICVNDNGIGTTQLAADSVTAAKVLPPVKGANADYIAVPVIACGFYGGSASNQTFTAFPAGIQIRHLVIHGSSGVVEMIRHNNTGHADGGIHAWNQASGANYTDLSISTNQFTVNGGCSVNLNDSKSYYWFAMGEWKQGPTS